MHTTPNISLLKNLEMASPNIPPIAPKQPVRLEKHGHIRTDPYFWLNERENPEVISYLEAENAYLDASMAHTNLLQESLFEEIKGRIKEDDSSVPYFNNGYWYYRRFEEGDEHPIFCRKKESLESAEEVMLNVNELAERHDFYVVSSLTVSTNNKLLAFTEDTQGRRINTIRFKNLETGEFMDDEIPGVTGNAIWANDNSTLFYTKQNPETLRWCKIFRHTLGTDYDEDTLVYEEQDETFYTHIFKTKSKKYLVIGSTQTLSAEYRYVNADTPFEPFAVIQPRERQLEYSVGHYGDHFYILTNLNAKNFRLMRAPITQPGKENWEEVIPHRKDVRLEGYELFSDFLVLEERRNGLVEIRIKPWDGSKEHYIEFEEEAYLAYTSVNLQFDTSKLRYIYMSMTTPTSTFDYDMRTHEKELLKQQEVVGTFTPDDYRTKRLFAPAQDGAKVPISVVYHKDTPIDGTAPLLLYAYGSYGSSLDATFSSTRLSLLDRGFVYAIAHIRGGEELGREWYENGKLLNKKNTFTDFIEAAEFLIASNYADKSRLFALGGSAGGLLMGAILNMRPDLWKGVIADVPFVDIVTTMLDDSIPLTTNEYDEWGNPNEREYYDYMLSYSPYDNVEKKDYPNLLVTTGLHDSQVQYWEPAKWVAKLRDYKTDDNLLLLKTSMDAGHGGVSGRFKRFKEVALTYAFLLDLAGKIEA